MKFNFAKRGNFAPLCEIGCIVVVSAPSLLAISAAILLMFTAITVNLTCAEMLRRPQPLAGPFRVGQGTEVCLDCKYTHRLSAKLIIHVIFTPPGTGLVPVPGRE